MENRTILIMMATYNGEKYISKQLETIINQTYTNWELIIRDDCSTDNTLGIIKDYVKKDSRIKYILSDSKKHGAYYNFFGLINYAKTLEKYDFYMFADQDDEWDSTKLEEYLKFYNEKNTSQRPTLVYGNMRIIDAHGQVTSENMDNLTGIGYTNVMTSFFAHKVYGCTIFFNFDLLKSLPVIENNDEVLGYLSHDNFVTKWAGIFGKVYYLPLTTMGYRRYNENVTSKHSYDYGFKRIFRRIFKINELAKDHALTYSQSLATIKIMRRENLSIEQMKILENIERVFSKGGFYGLKSVNRFEVDWGNKVKNISRKLILISSIYKKYLKM